MAGKLQWQMFEVASVVLKKANDRNVCILFSSLSHLFNLASPTRKMVPPTVGGSCCFDYGNQDNSPYVCQRPIPWVVLDCVKLTISINLLRCWLDLVFGV